jgi:adenine-specific DNA-methyltransferase
MAHVAQKAHCEGAALLERVEFLGLDVARKIDAARRAEMGQFLTPPTVSRLMASMFSPRSGQLTVLDPGAGIGSLTAALVEAACRWGKPPEAIHVVAYEVEPTFVEYLDDVLKACAALARRAGIRFTREVRKEDFIAAGVAVLRGEDLFTPRRTERHFNAAILNPPYRKINTDSRERRLLSSIGIETSNLYTAFLALTVRLLEPGGELVAITPRSFCNGVYFRPFRQEFLGSMALRRVHVFESRKRAFRGDDVLQENVIVHAAKGASRGRVVVTSAASPDDEDMVVREVEHTQIVRPDDADAFIHIVPDELDHRIGEHVRGLDASLGDLGLNVSTGRVVDFRARELLRAQPSRDTAPLIYPAHFVAGSVAWPNLRTRKPNALALQPAADDLLVAADFYVLVKRFSAKEERRRIVAAVYDPRRVPGERVGFENHLNYYHRNGAGLLPKLAWGLSAFLNSTLVDTYFRQFNGHTQVNAADLRSLRYPSREKLLAIGERVGEALPEQDELDHLIAEEVGMADPVDPVKAKKKIDEALAILKALGVPRGQQNERSALVLLALLDIKAATPWSNAGDPLRGITEMMDYFRDHFGKQYAPNTRETVRRQTIHQFVQMRLVVANPDNPARPVNSPDNRYQIEPSALKLLRTFGTPEWDKSLAAYLASADALRRLHPREREMTLIPVKLPDGTKLQLTAGGQNVLVKDIVEKFCPRFTPDGVVLYVGDTGDKYLHFGRERLERLGVRIDRHGKMPDVVIHYRKKDWLVLIEAVTSHGPVDLKRHNELKDLFRGAKVALVFVTAFLDRKAMMKYLGEIAWETEVWIAESPSHLIHFNGERFLGPYD